ncbi:response regulator transcription factor, partial [Trebonia sp.]|uniref:response regulator transcription factor n=1 Tax=Trebonia sp. TaxID=2767075 RepID=UPI002639F4E7
LGDHAVALLWTRGLALSAEEATALALSRPAGGRDVVEAAAAAAPAWAATAPLTPREMEIAALVAEGRSNKAIAGELVISPATVARHVANIMAKLGFRSRAQIAAWTAGRAVAVTAATAATAGRGLPPR